MPLTSVYSFGEDSPIKFEISDKLAKLYNEAVEQFFKAQVRFNQKFGRKWDPETDPINIKWNRGQRKAWNEFARVFDKTIEKQGPFQANDIMDDFLVKNVVLVAARTSQKWGRIILAVAAGGALYGYFRKR